MQFGAVVLLLTTAFTLNIPLGAWRRSQRKFSPAWFVGIHASIPALFLARIELDVPHWVIPLEVALVLAGQVIGARFGAWRTPARTEEPGVTRLHSSGSVAVTPSPGRLPELRESAD
jgi:hypothetical protein